MSIAFQTGMVRRSSRHGGIGDSHDVRPSPSVLDPSLCRHFALRGTCRFQQDCHYSHVLPVDCADWNEACQRIPCPHFERGICRYGSMCRLAHREEQFECPPGSQESMNEVVVKSEPSNNECAVPKKPNDHTMEEVMCGICMEPLGQTRNDKGEIKHNRKKFGLLSSCDHIFCIQCLRTWRYQQKKEALNEGRDNIGEDNGTGSDRVRACPLCRQASDFIVPSDRFCVGEEKEQVVASYKARLSCTPCKRFNGKLGSCPFGKDCFYAHFDCQTGRDMKKMDRTKQELWQEKTQKQRIKAQRHRSERRRRFFPNISQEEMDVMEDLIYLSSMERFLDPNNSSDPNGHDDDDNGGFADRLIYVDDNGNATFAPGVTLNPHYVEAILNAERLRTLGILE